MLMNPLMGIRWHWDFVTVKHLVIQMVKQTRLVTARGWRSD